MRGRSIVVALFAGLLGGGPAASAPGDPPPVAPPAAPPAAPAPVPAEEPELVGEAKERHEAEVKDILKELTKEKNREAVRMRIETLGAGKSRAARDALILFAEKSGNQEFTKHAFTALGKIGGKKVVEFLCGKDALRSGDFLVQQAAADALGEVRNPLAAGPLLEVLTAKGTKIEVMGSVARAAARSAPKDDRVVETLFRLVEHKKDTIRANAMEALGYLASDAAMNRLAEALQKDDNSRVRGAAAAGIGHSARKDMIPVLSGAMAAENALNVKSEIQKAITALETSGR
jgi:HEAT repeat protein